MIAIGKEWFATEKEKYKMVRKDTESFACLVGFMVIDGFYYNRKLKIRNIFLTSIKKMAFHHLTWTIFNTLSSIRVKTHTSKSTAIFLEHYYFSNRNNISIGESMFLKF